MTSIVLEYPREDAKTLVKAAFENTKGIKEYNDDGHRIIGKTGMGLASYGEQVTVEIPETQSNDNETMVSISSEAEVSINVTANPDKYESRFIEQLENLRGRNIDTVLDEMSKTMSPSESKEVDSSTDLSDGSSRVLLVMVIVMIFFFLFMMMTMATMP